MEKKVIELNPLLKSFVDSHREFLEAFYKEPSTFNRERLDKSFKSFYQKVRLLSYFKKTLHYEAVRYDKKLRDHQEKYKLTLDMPLSNASDEKEKILDNIVGESGDHEEEISYEKIENYVSDVKLNFIIAQLTERQKEVFAFSNKCLNV